MTLAWTIALFLRDYAITVVVEGTVLWFALDRRHDRAMRLLAAWWLSGVTFPIVQFAFPLLQLLGWPRWAWVSFAEFFAPAAECALFAILVSSQSDGRQHVTRRDMLAVILANLVSFVVGEALLGAGVR